MGGILRINNKESLLYILLKDKEHLHINNTPSLFSIQGLIYRFEKALRYHEYYHNTSPSSKLHGPIHKCLKAYWATIHNLLGLILGYEIPVNTFGAGLRINHKGVLIVHAKVRVGENCDIHQMVNIGEWGEKEAVPTIGDNVFIGPGAKLFGKINIADNCKIGANAVVNKSFMIKGTTIVGIPAKGIEPK